MMEDLRSLEYPELNTGVFADYGGSFPMCQSQINHIEDYSMNLLSQYSPQVDQEINELEDQLLNLLPAFQFHVS